MIAWFRSLFRPPLELTVAAPDQMGRINEMLEQLRAERLR